MSISMGSRSTNFGILIANFGVKLEYESERVWDISTHTHTHKYSQWMNEMYVFVYDVFFTRVKFLIHLNENVVP